MRSRSTREGLARYYFVQCSGTCKAKTDTFSTEKFAQSAWNQRDGKMWSKYPPKECGEYFVHLRSRNDTHIMRVFIRDNRFFVDTGTDELILDDFCASHPDVVWIKVEYPSLVSLGNYEGEEK